MMTCRISKITRNSLFGFHYSLSSYGPGSQLGFKSSIRSAASKDSAQKEQVDPFSLVATELSLVADSLRSMVTSEVPVLTSASEYFFRKDVEGKKICPTVLFLMAKSFSLPKLEDHLITQLHERQHRIAAVTEIIHVASLIHDDVLDVADTRRGVSSLNLLNGNKLAILAGDFLLFRAFSELASLKNTEAVELMATALENLVRGETMQMTATSDKSCSMKFYMQKTYNKTASLISNSCKAQALLSDQTEHVADMAFQYGKNLGLAYQLIDDVLDFTGSSASLGKASLSDLKNGIITAPMLFAVEDFPQLRDIVYRGFSDSANLDIAIEYLRKSSGLQRTRELAMKHSELAAAAINSLPETTDENAVKARQALVHLAQRILIRKK